MMMSKPEAKTTTTTKAAPVDAVADLERRLADLSSATPNIPAFAVAPPAAPAAPAPVAAPAAAAPAGNKNALLARIMAAQERAKQAQGGASPTMAMAPPQDLLSMDNYDNTPPPALFEAPPAFEESFLPPPQESAPPPPPPAFDTTVLPPPPAQEQQEPALYMQWDPHAPLTTTAPPPPSASAPAFEDLMDSTAAAHQHHHPVAMMPPVMQPPAADDGIDDETLQMILGIEGLSAAEKQEMIDEQMKIMKSIQDSKKSAQVTAADAFEQRSFSAAVSAVDTHQQNTSTSTSTTTGGMQLHGQERTREAIADGTAVMVQCTACENWMQVTGTAQLMFCPVCQTVSPVQGSGLTNEEAQQMAADAKLAEQLQKEEYEEADRSNAAAAGSSPRSAARAPSSASKDQGWSSKTSSSSAKEQGWMEWLGFGTQVAAPPPATRGGASGGAKREEEIAFSNSRGDAEDEGLLSGGRRQGGRVATQQPLFACVTDSISTAANYAMSIPQEDEEGNVHGVDSSSLLAVTQVGRGGNNNESNQRYEQLPGNGTN